MDSNANVPEVRSGDGSPSPVRALRPVDKNNPERLQWIWNHLVTQDYAVDDPGKALGAQAFLGQLFSEQSEWWEIGDEGIAAFMGIIPEVSAFFHFAVWGDLGLHELLPLQHQLFTDIFTRLDLNRICGIIPAFNKLAIRAATIAGFRYEGEFRKSFLKRGVYYNQHIYGILREEFFRKERPQ